MLLIIKPTIEPLYAVNSKRHVLSPRGSAQFIDIKTSFFCRGCAFKLYILVHLIGLF